MPQIILITGANRGIGLALTAIYLHRGDKVYAVCRQTSDELNNSDANIIESIDVSLSEDVKNLQQQMQGISIDVLINNAGIFKNESLDTMNFESIEEQLTINAIAPLRISHALLSNLHAGSKIGFITSRMGSITDNGSGNYYGYRMSKAALNAAGKSLANDLKTQDISVAILHPGMVSTRMINFAGDVSPEKSAQGLVARLDELTSETTGTFWHANGEILPW
ncbi:MAG: NAD(P)-dependent dehydrogenase (short-subunit alcohol dehydrogenase family) [Gammaproteobacteria bacterium]|jgi:NAD(P)-dependent dehydrogenase (short-subunit alcohol dehydrogenase family)